MPTVKIRGNDDEKLVWYWNHSTVKSPVPTAQSLLAGTLTYWLVPLKLMLPPDVACEWRGARNETSPRPHTVRTAKRALARTPKD